jgi:hypothetical protein
MTFSDIITSIQLSPSFALPRFLSHCCSKNKFQIADIDGLNVLLISPYSQHRQHLLGTISTITFLLDKNWATNGWNNFSFSRLLLLFVKFLYNLYCNQYYCHITFSLRTINSRTFITNNSNNDSNNNNDSILICTLGTGSGTEEWESEKKYNNFISSHFVQHFFYRFSFIGTFLLYGIE